MQPLKNFPAFYGTRRFNTVFTRALHWSLEPYQSNPHHPISLRPVLILPTPPTSWSSQWSLSFWLSHQYPICIPLLPPFAGNKPLFNIQDLVRTITKSPAFIPSRELNDAFRDIAGTQTAIMTLQQASAHTYS
jgi:hypothetical protein